MGFCRWLVLLLALAAVAGAADAQCSLPFEWVPGHLLVGIRAASLGQLDSGALLRGETRTGLASLDTLIAQTGVLSIEPIGLPEGPPDVLWLRFPESTDVCAMAALYGRNEHVILAEPNYLLPTSAAADTPWSLVKKACCDPTAGAEAWAPKGTLATPGTADRADAQGPESRQ